MKMQHGLDGTLSLSIETKSHLMNISEMEIRVTEEIRAKLLKTLDEYPAPESLKEPFRVLCNSAGSDKFD
jgi:hypothetical protein